MAEGESILIVEDNREMRIFVRDLLQERGYHIIEANSGWKGLQLAETAPPDLLLLDWQLPDISGLDVLRALRMSRNACPAILMTGYGSEELALIALRLGVRDYLRKPFAPEELFTAVESALAESRLRREHELLVKQLARATRQLGENAQRIIVARNALKKLVFLTDELRRSRGENWMTRIEEARRYILQIAEAIEGLAHTSKQP